MVEKEIWLRRAQETSERYLAPGSDFNGHMGCRLIDCSYAESSFTFAFESMDWQRNDRGELHGGAIAGMFDTAFGVAAYITAGGPVTVTAELNISFLSAVSFGTDLRMRVIVLKAGKSLIRQRAELADGATGRLLAVAGGSWAVFPCQA